MDYRFELTAIDYNGIKCHERNLKTLQEAIYHGRLMLNRGASEVFISDTKTDLQINMDEGCNKPQSFIVL